MDRACRTNGEEKRNAYRRLESQKERDHKEDKDLGG
jgi:hypothetical protein